MTRTEGQVIASKNMTISGPVLSQGASLGSSDKVSIFLTVILIILGWLVFISIRRLFRLTENEQVKITTGDIIDKIREEATEMKNILSSPTSELNKRVLQIEVQIGVLQNILTNKSKDSGNL
jgi:hypothetical protein